jgi:hypothetical protein
MRLARATITATALIGGLVLLGALALVLPAGRATGGPTSTLPSAASLGSWKQNCAQLDLCLERAALQTMRQQGPRQTLDDLTTLSTHDATLQAYCHSLAHVLGRAAYQQIGSVTAALAVGTSFCNNGFTHGVFEAWGQRTPFSSVVADAHKVCSRYRGTDRDTCNHGVGHAVWFATPASVLPNERLQQSVTGCGLIFGSTNKDLNNCVAGVMMTGLQASKPIATIRSAEDLSNLCAAFPLAIRSGCLTNAGPILVAVHLGNDLAALADCPRLAAVAWETPCALSIGMLLAYDHGTPDVARYQGECASTPTELMSCLQGIAVELKMDVTPAGQKALDGLCSGLTGSEAARCAAFRTSSVKELTSSSETTNLAAPITTG